MTMQLISSFSVCITRCIAARLLGVTLHAIGLSFAPSMNALQGQEVFVPPKAYPTERYQAEWNKNPFTLKTAPVALESKSFAQDLAIGTFFGDKDNPTVVIVNTKTRERTALRKDSPAANGMELNAVSIQPSRKNTFAEVSLHGETAVLRFDDSYLRQMEVDGAAVSKENPSQATKAAPDQKRIIAGVAPSDPPVPGSPPVGLNTRFPLRDAPRLHDIPPSKGGPPFTPTSQSRVQRTMPNRSKLPSPPVEPAR